MASLAAIVLAAGAASRFGGANKLLVEIEGQPLVARVVEAVARAQPTQLVVVTGRDDELIAAALAGLPVTLVHNPDWRSGMGGSIACGVSGLDSHVEAAFIVPADLPHLTADLLVEMAAVFARHARDPIVFPATADGEQRNPVLWPHRFFSDLAQLSGHAGAKTLLAANVASTVAVHVADRAVFEDIDTPDDLAKVRAGNRPLKQG